MHPENKTHHSCPAVAALWDGKKQLSGVLTLTPEHLIFQFDDFRKSHLNLQIPLREIEKVESFLIFEISRKGLKVICKDGHEDLFVLDDPLGFKKELAKLTLQTL